MVELGDLVLLIRRSKFHNQPWKDFLQQIGCRVIDITATSHIQINFIDSEQQRSITFKGIELESFKKIFWFDTPFSNNTPNELFALSEFNACLWACLEPNSKLMFNSFFSQVQRHELRTPTYICSILSAIGWKLPEITYNYDFSIESVERNISIDEKSIDIKLFLGKYDYFFYPYYSISFEKYNEFECLVYKTQEYMRTNKIDIIGLYLSINDDDILLMGASIDLDDIDLNKTSINHLKELL